MFLPAAHQFDVLQMNIYISFGNIISLIPYYLSRNSPSWIVTEHEKMLTCLQSRKILSLHNFDKHYFQ